MLRTAAPVEASSPAGAIGLPCPVARAESGIPRSALNVAESTGDGRLRNIRGDADFAHAFRQHPVDSPAHSFLIAGKKTQDTLYRDISNGWQGADGSHQIHHAF